MYKTLIPLSKSDHTCQHVTRLASDMSSD